MYAVKIQAVKSFATVPLKVILTICKGEKVNALRFDTAKNKFSVVTIIGKLIIFFGFITTPVIYYNNNYYNFYTFIISYIFLHYQFLIYGYVNKYC